MTWLIGPGKNVLERDNKSHLFNKCKQNTLNERKNQWVLIQSGQAGQVPPFCPGQDKNPQGRHTFVVTDRLEHLVAVPLGCKVTRPWIRLPEHPRDA